MVAQLVGGPYQMRCPADTGLEEQPSNGKCDRQDLVRVGAGPVSPQPPLRDSAAEATTGADGRIWIVDSEQKRLVLSADDAKTWQELPLPPGLLQLSADGKQAWVFGDGTMWELVDPNHWRKVFTAEVQWGVYLGEGLWLVKPVKQVETAYFQDGQYTPLGELGAG